MPTPIPTGTPFRARSRSAPKKSAFSPRRKADQLFELSRRFVGDPSELSVLDVGCGIGTTDQYLTGRFGAVHGVDVAAEAVARAAADNPGAHYQAYSGETLPNASASLDVVFAACVLHHIPPAERARVRTRDAACHAAGRIGRRVRAQSRQPTYSTRREPLRVRRRGRAAFSAQHCSLARRKRTRGSRKAYIVFFPWERRPLPTIEHWIRRVPLGAQYYVAGRS